MTDATPAATAAAPIGDNETKELLVGIFALNEFLVVQLKDGFQPGADINALMSKLLGDEVFRAKLENAIKGIGAVPAEVKDLSLNEGIELGLLVIEGVKSIVAASKPAPQA